jgi:predicted amidohydrolase
MTKVRISAVGFRAGPVASFAEFGAHVRRLTDEAAKSEPDFVVFPELFSTFELMSIFGELPLPDLFARSAELTDDYLDLVRGLAREYGTHIIAGSHFTRVGEESYNVSYLCMPDGGMIEQAKCHLFPPEKSSRWARCPARSSPSFRRPRRTSPSSPATTSSSPRRRGS